LADAAAAEKPKASAALRRSFCLFYCLIMFFIMFFSYSLLIMVLVQINAFCWILEFYVILILLYLCYLFINSFLSFNSIFYSIFKFYSFNQILLNFSL